MRKFFTITGNLLAQTTCVFDMPKPGGTARAKLPPKFDVGGKGVNVARTLAALGADCAAAVFPAGFSGKRCAGALAGENFETIAVEISGETRGGLVCADSRTGARTTFLGADIPVPPGALEKCLEKIKEKIGEGDVVAICGSFPGWGEAHAEMLSRLVAEKKAILCADTYGAPLASLAREKCAAIKINKAELFSFLKDAGEPAPESFYGAFLSAQKKYFLNAQIFAATDGAGEFFFRENEKIFSLTPPKIEREIDPTGCGDAMFAVLLSEIFLKKSGAETAFRRAAKYASMCAETESVGVLPPEKARQAL
ncbi:MAG: hypothetical protein IJI37_00240, partial [Opitutales bacterium]|nr:hypothetical protein [Opitutales bacterium]